MGEYIKILMLFLLFIVIYLYIEYKSTYFIPQKYNFIWYLSLIFSSRIIGLRSYDIFENSTVLLVIVICAGVGLIFQKNSMYLYKGIEKKFINENKNELTKIIANYKNNNINYKAEITLFKNRIVFEKVSKPHVEECMSLIISHLNENKREYTTKDKAIYIIKSWLLPIAIIFLTGLLLWFIL